MLVTENRENVNNAAAVDARVYNETLADVVAALRRMAEVSKTYANRFRHPCLRMEMEMEAEWRKRFADRIEAAAKRDAAIHAMTVEANERLREHLEIALENDKRTAVGNAAAMRGAGGDKGARR